ncbi:hypothetical protein GWI33_022203 [Rhynchophorus ferrugineus]|uniref:Uncharacterized protein n=1 Tax=Rhynchophorus ferrugineus TaxID=354439 RepID=A0A834IQL5_RHYFE|nr:hypothetical protein GWI33_022203 [Rhynchophorus ferrugineus]
MDKKIFRVLIKYCLLKGKNTVEAKKSVLIGTPHCFLQSMLRTSSSSAREEMVVLRDLEAPYGQPSCSKKIVLFAYQSSSGDGDPPSR